MSPWEPNPEMPIKEYACTPSISWWSDIPFSKAPWTIHTRLARPRTALAWRDPWTVLAYILLILPLPLHLALAGLSHLFPWLSCAARIGIPQSVTETRRRAEHGNITHVYSGNILASGKMSSARPSVLGWSAASLQSGCLNWLKTFSNADLVERVVTRRDFAASSDVNLNDARGPRGHWVLKYEWRLKKHSQIVELDDVLGPRWVHSAIRFRAVEFGLRGVIFLPTPFWALSSK